MNARSLNLAAGIVPAEIFAAPADQRDEHRDGNTADHAELLPQAGEELALAGRAGHSGRSSPQSSG